MKKFRTMVYHNRRSDQGKPTVAFGIRIGYWPCLKGPFIALAVGPVSLDLWWGLSAKNGNRRAAM